MIFWKIFKQKFILRLKSWKTREKIKQFCKNYCMKNIRILSSVQDEYESLKYRLFFVFIRNKVCNKPLLLTSIAKMVACKITFDRIICI